MMTSVQFIESRFELSARLPDQVFKKVDDLTFAFADAAILTAPEGWDLIKRCTLYFGDEDIYGLVLDNLAHAKESPPTLCLPSGSTRELFINWLDHEVGAGKIPLYIDARTVALTGSSGAWGLWIEQDRELAILGTSRAVSSGQTEFAPDALSWLPVSQVADLLEPAFYPDPVPGTLLDQLMKAYGASTLS